MNLIVLFTLLSLAALAGLIGGAVAMWAIHTAPDGFEDQDGFHAKPSPRRQEAAHEDAHSIPHALVH